MGALEQSMRALPEVGGTLRRVRAGAVLPDGDFFGLKQVLFYGIQSIEHTRDLWLAWEVDPDEHLGAARALMHALDSERVPTASFRWRDATDDALALARKHTARARRLMHARRDEVERALLEDYEGARVDVHGHLVLLASQAVLASTDARLRAHGPSWVPQDEALSLTQQALELAQDAQAEALALVRQRSSVHVHAHARWLEGWRDMLALLDHRLAKVRLLEAVGGCWPERARSPRLALTQARAARLPPNAQPIDLEVECDRPLVITGPNMGGKSVLLNLVGLAPSGARGAPVAVPGRAGAKLGARGHRVRGRG